MGADGGLRPRKPLTWQRVHGFESHPCRHRPAETRLPIRQIAAASPPVSTMFLPPARRPSQDQPGRGWTWELITVAQAAPLRGRLRRVGPSHPRTPFLLAFRLSRRHPTGFPRRGADSPREPSCYPMVTASPHPPPPVPDQPVLISPSEGHLHLEVPSAWAGRGDRIR